MGHPRYLFCLFSVFLKQALQFLQINESVQELHGTDSPVSSPPRLSLGHQGFGFYFPASL